MNDMQMLYMLYMFIKPLLAEAMVEACIAWTLGLPLLSLVRPGENSNGAVSRALWRQHHVIPSHCYLCVEGPAKAKEVLVSRLGSMCVLVEITWSFTWLHLNI